MAKKMTLVKGPTLQKLLVVTLLTLTGLGYPPPLVEADKCYTCGGRKEPSCSSPIEDTCYTPGCLLTSTEGVITTKSCLGDDGRVVFDCIANGLGQGGQSCVQIDGGNKEHVRIASQCLGGRPGGRVNEHLGEMFGIVGNSTEGRGGGGGGGKLGKMCKCTGDLCNTDSLVGGAEMVGGDKNGLQQLAMIGGIILLATNGLFY